MPRRKTMLLLVILFSIGSASASLGQGVSDASAYSYSSFLTTQNSDTDAFERYAFNWARVGVTGTIQSDYAPVNATFEYDVASNRLMLAYGESEFGNWSFRFGQQYSVVQYPTPFAEELPTTRWAHAMDWYDNSVAGLAVTYTNGDFTARAAKYDGKNNFATTLGFGPVSAVFQRGFGGSAYFQHSFHSVLNVYTGATLFRGEGARFESLDETNSYFFQNFIQISAPLRLYTLVDIVDGPEETLVSFLGGFTYELAPKTVMKLYYDNQDLGGEEDKRYSALILECALFLGSN